MTDLYKILGVEKTATAAEIKRAYREMALKYHPDRNSGSKEAEEKFKEINEAWSVLGDEAKRRQYDLYGSSGQNYGSSQNTYTNNQSTNYNYDSYDEWFKEFNNFANNARHYTYTYTERPKPQRRRKSAIESIIQLMACMFFITLFPFSLIVWILCGLGVLNAVKNLLSSLISFISDEN